MFFYTPTALIAKILIAFRGVTIVLSKSLCLHFGNFLLGQRSSAPPVDSSFERGELDQVQDVDALVPCWIDDYELCAVSVSLFTVQLRCACIHFRTSFLTLRQIFFKLFSVRSFQNGINLIPDKIEASVVVDVGQAIGHPSTDICLDCRCVRCDF